MSVILVTGQPGSGKTALVVDMFAHDEQFKGRPLFAMGIPDLAIDHTEVPPVAEWTEMRQAPEDASIELPYFRFPEGAVIVLDEAQRVYRPRPVGSRVPPEVAAFETHRHTGVDFILLTQAPGLIDSNIRKLIGRHVHIRVTPFGRYKYEWTELGDPESSSSRELAAKERYSPPKRAFKLYKSSQLHTKIKTKMPWYVWLFAVCAVSFVGLAYYAYGRVTARSQGELQTKLPDPGNPGQSLPAASPGQSPVKTFEQYYEERIPRLPGLLHTAPVYDELTKANDAPWPSACMIVSAWQGREAKCRCLDQQGNEYPTTPSVCRDIALNGRFKDWGEKVRHEPRTQPQPSRPVEVAVTSPQPVAGLGMSSPLAPVPSSSTPDGQPHIPPAI